MARVRAIDAAVAILRREGTRRQRRRRGRRPASTATGRPRRSGPTNPPRWDLDLADSTGGAVRRAARELARARLLAQLPTAWSLHSERVNMALPRRTPVRKRICVRTRRRGRSGQRQP